MTTEPRFQLALPEIDDSPDSELAHFAPIAMLLECLTRINQIQMRFAASRGRAYPPLYASGVRYQEEAPGKEDWPDIPTILGARMGKHTDCEDLAAWRCAELREAGIQCDPAIKWRHIARAEMLTSGYPAGSVPAGGVWLVHCLVRFPDGTTEDPSKILGMGGHYTSTV